MGACSYTVTVNELPLMYDCGLRGEEPLDHFVALAGIHSSKKLLITQRCIA